MTMDKNKTDSRPGSCYLLHPTDSSCVVKIRLGVPGFYPISCAPNPEEAAKLARTLNRADGLKLSPAIAEAMLVGSMFGWGVPGAFPEAYGDKKATGGVMHPEAERE